MKSWYRQDIRYMFTSSVILNFFVMISDTLHMFVWIWHHPVLFPSLIQLCSQPPPLCCYCKYITFICYLPNKNWASLVAQTVKNLPAMQETRFNPSVRKIPWRREWLTTSVFLPGESHGQRSLGGYGNGVAKSQTRLSNYLFHNNLCGIVLDSCFLNTGRSEMCIHKVFSFI